MAVFLFIQMDALVNQLHKGTGHYYLLVRFIECSQQMQDNEASKTLTARYKSQMHVECFHCKDSVRSSCKTCSGGLKVCCGCHAMTDCRFARMLLVSNADL